MSSEHLLSEEMGTVIENSENNISSVSDSSEFKYSNIIAILKELLSSLKKGMQARNLSEYFGSLQSYIGKKFNDAEFRTDLAEVCNTCIEIILTNVIEVSETEDEEKQILQELLILLSSVKLNTFTKDEKIESNDIVLTICKTGCKLIKYFIQYEYYEKANYYITLCKEVLKEFIEDNDKSKLICDEKESLNLKNILQLYYLEMIIKTNSLEDVVQEILNIEKPEFFNTMFQKYFIRLCFNVGLKCNNNEQYEWAIDILKTAYSIRRTSDSPNEDIFSVLRLLSSIYLKHLPSQNWQNAINTLDLAYKDKLDKFYIISKLKAALLSGKEDLVQEVLNQVKDWEGITVDIALNILIILKYTVFENIGADFIMMVTQERFLEQDKINLMCFELKIRLHTACFERATEIVEYVIKVASNETIETSLACSICKVILSFAQMKFKDKSYDECLTWYKKCARLLELVYRNEEMSFYVEKQICYCYIKLEKKDAAQASFEKLNWSVLDTDPLNIYLALQISLISENEKLAEEALKNLGNTNTDLNSIFLDVIKTAFTSGKEAFLYKVLEALLFKNISKNQNMFQVKIAKCLVSLRINCSGDEKERNSKLLIYIDKALEILQRRLQFDHCDIMSLRRKNMDDIFLMWGIRRENMAVENEAEVTEICRWFSRVAWNLALKAGDEIAFVYDFFLRCCIFLELAGGPYSRLRNALMLTIAAGVEVVRNMPKEHSSEKEATIRNILTHVAKCRSLDNRGNFNILRLLHMYEFEVLLHMNDTSCEEALEEILHLPYIDAKTLEHTAAIAYDFNTSNYKIILKALRGALNKILENPNEDSTHVSQTFHCLLSILFYAQEFKSFATEEDTMKECKNLLNLIQNGMKDYPQIEILWTTIKCWNCGIRKLSFGNTRRAYDWCSLAMEFQKKLTTFRSLYEKKFQTFFSAYFADFDINKSYSSDDLHD